MSNLSHNAGQRAEPSRARQTDSVPVRPKSRIGRPRGSRPIALLLVTVALGWTATVSAQPNAPVSPARQLAARKPLAVKTNPAQVALGRSLFSDTRLSGDATISCATCHQPDRAWTDGVPLSAGYPGSLYFRNTLSILNLQSRKRFYWDGRMGGDDLPSLVRDHIAEAHFLQADGRLVIERLKQVPVYVEQFQKAFDGEPTYGRILNAVAAFVLSRQSSDSPVDRHLRGESDALSESARRGLDVFTAKGKCIRCHHGVNLHDDQLHNLGVSDNPLIFSAPRRHITFRRFFRTFGVPDYRQLRTDIGHACVTKQSTDRGAFRTPSLREVAKTAPYMHNGMLKTLEDVVAFYNQGGGETQAAGLEPLELSAQEQQDLVAFLRSLSSDMPKEATPVLPPYALIPPNAALDHQP